LILRPANDLTEVVDRGGRARQVAIVVKRSEVLRGAGWRCPERCVLIRNRQRRRADDCSRFVNTCPRSSIPEAQLSPPNEPIDCMPLVLSQMKPYTGIPAALPAGAKRKVTQ